MLGDPPCVILKASLCSPSWPTPHRGGPGNTGSGNGWGTPTFSTTKIYEAGFAAWRWGAVLAWRAPMITQTKVEIMSPGPDSNTCSFNQDL